MIVEEHITRYLHSLDSDAPKHLESLRKEAEADGVPLIRREMERFLCVLLAMNRPERILEIGTGIGYSSVFMATFSETVRHIDTIENYPPRIEKAKKAIAPFRETITLLEGDATEVIRTLETPYDFIFLDGPKAQYPFLLPELKRLLKTGGVLLSDNVLQEGELVRSRFAVSHRDRTIHERMRTFLEMVTHDPELVTSVVTIGDGVSLSIKQETKRKT